MRQFLAADLPPEFTARLEKESGKKIKLPDKKAADRVRRSVTKG